MPQIQLRIQFHALRFGNGLVSITHKKIRYIYRNYNIRNFDKILKQIYSRVSKAWKNTIKASYVKVQIDTETGSFTFIDFDVCKYVNNLRENFLLDNKNAEARKEIPSKVKIIKPQKLSNTQNTMTIGIGNIHFYNGYFLIFRTIKEEIDYSVTPYKINDPDSHEILNLVHKYFEQRFEQMRIVVKYNNTMILEPSRFDRLELSKYVRALKRNMDVKGEWWEEVQNARKRTLAQCHFELNSDVKKRAIKKKNDYLYNLSTLQNDKKLIRVYEINHGKEEDAFIFTISMTNDRCAIVFENASKDAQTTTWLFVAKNENYEDCVNLVFDYFTDYTKISKRSSLRDAYTNPPYMFKAESYTFIDHNDLGKWLRKMNKVLERTSCQETIEFSPGLHIPQSQNERAGHKDTITTKSIHNELMHRLYYKLCKEHGEKNVGTEIHIGTRRIDAVVKESDCFDIYEIKSDPNPFNCVTEALGQICQYAYLYCRDKIGKMVIVGSSAATSEVEDYLSWFRNNHSLQVYYTSI